MDSYLQEHIAALRNEVELDRLADQATPPSPPVRLRLAYRLHALAEWVERPCPEDPGRQPIGFVNA
jgi:hypothetical protein